MIASMALSGKSPSPFDLHTFVRSFVAALVLRGVPAVRPHSPADRKGFENVLRALSQRLDQFEKQNADPQLVRQLVRILNELRPSNTGGYEGFETALRSLQLTFTSCPNPFYEEITFLIPKPYAKATVDGLPTLSRELVDQAADAFASALST